MMAACSHQLERGCKSNIEKKQPKAEPKGLFEVKGERAVWVEGEMPLTEHKEQTLNALLLDPFQLRGAPGLCGIQGSHTPVLMLLAHRALASTVSRKLKDVH